MDKTLGQIAYETAVFGQKLWPAWELVSTKDGLERIGAAVAAAVKEEDARIIVDLYDCTETRNINDFAAAIRASIKEVK